MGLSYKIRRPLPPPAPPLPLHPATSAPEPPSPYSPHTARAGRGLGWGRSHPGESLSSPAAPRARASLVLRLKWAPDAQYTVGRPPPARHWPPAGLEGQSGQTRTGPRLLSDGRQGLPGPRGWRERHGTAGSAGGPKTRRAGRSVRRGRWACPRRRLRRRRGP